MPLLEDCKMEVIRHLEYEVIGLYQNQPSGGSGTLGNAGMRYFGPFGSLMYRLQLLRPVEEAKITGVATGSIQFTGADPTPGNIIAATVNASILTAPITVTVVVPDRNWSLVQLAQEIANAFMLTAEFQAAGFWALADYGPGPWSQQKVATPVVSINAPLSISTFTLSATYVGATVPQVISVPRPVSPYITFRTVAGINTIYGFVPILGYLESAYGGATANLSIREANTVKTNPEELEDRSEQYRIYQQKLSTFLGIPINAQARGRDNQNTHTMW